MPRLNLLLNMLSYKRPSQEKYITGKFIERFLTPLGVKFDGYGNVYKKIGDNNILYSSHIDTVSETAGFQKTQVIGDYIHLATKYKKQSGNVLGGDCTAGIFIMSEMIKAGIEGLYIFHLDEEIGGAGSQYILDNVLVCENRKYRDLNPYNNLIEDLTIDESFKQKYRDNAQKHYPNEIEKFKNRL